MTNLKERLYKRINSLKENNNEYNSDFKDNPKLRKVYLAIINNIKSSWYKNKGKIGKRHYDYWDNNSLEDGVHRAHRIANSIIARKHPEYFSKNKISKTSISDIDKEELDYYYNELEKYNRYKDFNNPDYNHVHNKGE